MAYIDLLQSTVPILIAQLMESSHIIHNYVGLMRYFRRGLNGFLEDKGVKFTVVDSFDERAIGLFTLEKMNQRRGDEGIDHAQYFASFHLFEFRNNGLEGIGTVFNNRPDIKRMDAH